MIEPELLSKISMLAPGTRLRKALDDIVMASSGALILFVDHIKNYEDIIQGGFCLDESFTPEKLYELAKMDGAIILDEDVTKILAANVHLVPDPSIPTAETGIRHRTAERVAKRSEKFVLAVSKRKKVITAYYKVYKYVMSDINFLITKVSQALNTLQKYGESLSKMIFEIDVEEFEGRVNLVGVVDLINKGIQILKICEDIQPFVTEIGSEGKLAEMELHEVEQSTDALLRILIMDYSRQPSEYEESTQILNALSNLKELGRMVTARTLGYEVQSVGQMEEMNLTPRGYRMLKYVAKIPMNISNNVVAAFKDISQISMADLDALKLVEGIGQKRARAIIESINSIKNRVSLRKTEVSER